MQLTRLSPGDEALEELAHFIFTVNSDQTQQISYFGDKEAEILQYLKDTTVPASASFLLLREDANALTGVFGFDFAPHVGRVFLYGPLINHPDWHSLADQLWQELQTFFPSETQELEIFCNILNTRCIEFAARHQFPHHSDHLILRCAKEDPGAAVKTSAVELAPDYYPQAATLQDAIFVQSPLKGTDMVRQLDETHKLFGVVAEGQLLGYTYCEVEPQFGEASVEFVGVSESARGRGIGKELVRAALDWFFTFDTIVEVFLVTETTNQAAIRVYQKAGFKTLYTTRSFRKHLAAN